MSVPAPVAISPASSPEERLFCPNCNYDLRGIGDSRRCPECGLEIDRQELVASRIPWTHRRRIGRVRAYGRTFWLATVQTKTLGREVIRPVAYGDAQRFRLITTVIAAIVPSVGLLVALLHFGAEGPSVLDPFLGSSVRPPPGLLDAYLPWTAGATLLPVLPLCAALFLFAAMGIPSYWFHPRRLPVIKQNRAVALSYYACAPLVLILPAGICFSVVALCAAAADTASTNHAIEQVALVFSIAGGTLAIVGVVAFYANTLRLLHQATTARTGRLVAAAILIPLASLACAVLTLFIIPWAIGFLRIVIESLRV